MMGSTAFVQKISDLFWFFIITLQGLKVFSGLQMLHLASLVESGIFFTETKTFYRYEDLTDKPFKNCSTG
jgi:hypothetical protein